MGNQEKIKERVRIPIYSLSSSDPMASGPHHVCLIIPFVPAGTSSLRISDLLLDNSSMSVSLYVRSDGVMLCYPTSEHRLATVAVAC